jgi:hypothetical protein
MKYSAVQHRKDRNGWDYYQFGRVDLLQQEIKKAYLMLDRAGDHQQNYQNESE